MSRPKNPKNWCSICNKQIKNSKSGLCRQHWIERKALALSNRTMKSFHSTYARHKHQNIRNHAQRVASALKLKKICVVCGYSIHVELCHKTPIHKYTEDNTLDEINNPKNLVYLCPNHHWELDHKILSL